ncbi:hypothetical protein [Falsibacillus albus]|uniref:hypothetical protein n=1 Tax=Falsibacillus albus TaxID=2478915 RepID=UPI0018F35914|nr:hypothetical protein [Falsibacillus albus]
MYPHYYRPYYYPVRHGNDERFFFGFGLLPFLAGGLAGLAVGPFLFNRPCCPPYYPYPPYGMPYAGGYPMGQMPYGAPGAAPQMASNMPYGAGSTPQMASNSPYGAGSTPQMAANMPYGTVNETVNVFTK